MFNPIAASKNIRDEFIDYITTSFSFADRSYEQQFKAALRREDAVAKGPYLDIGGSYETGHTLRQLMESGDAYRGFAALERAPEAQRELKLDRPLYLHQEAALRKANAGKSMIVTTGTGSGKTECFLIPVVNYLLREMEAGELDDAVRAIVIYPMNALANDQMKRMRALLKDCEAIRFGLYNGNTKHRRSDALADYRRAHRNAEPLPNEVLSREEMQERPPHILITNYSMMEYMLLRPRDGGVFRNAHLKFIILDEAHIYRGATGMETALLLRRMRARIPHREQLQYILTSATLGGPEDDEQILEFGKRLCGVEFARDCIIRSKLQRHEIQTRRDVPMRLFVELSEASGSVLEILRRYGLDAIEGADDEERLYDLCLNSRIYEALRLAAATPVTIPELVVRVAQLVPVTEEELIAFIEVCARAGRDGAKLIRPRYHIFVRAPEGAYITIGDRKELYLNRRNVAMLDVGQRVVFEAAVCTDCGRVALAGKNSEGKLVQTANRAEDDSGEYYLIKDPEDDAWFLDEDESAAIDDYVVCSVCGAIRSDNGGAKYPCEHGAGAYVRVLKVTGRKDGACRCPACGNGRLRKFYLGSEAATAVLGMDLFEQLPDEESEAPAARAATAAPAARGLFGVRRERVVRRERMRQFLCFSDSRSEAAYFASYMERMYGEFLRRRGVWHVAEKFRREGRFRVSMRDFVRELTVYFESNKSFMEWDATGSAYGVSKENAWVAMLNELYSARRASGLISMGVFSVCYRGKNEEDTEAPINYFIEKFGLSEREARALQELLILDGIYTGAIDAGREELLSEAQREYIFFSPTPQKLVKLKNASESARTSEHGWCARERTNGNYYPNVRVSRLCNALGVEPETANKILDEYWNEVFQVETETFIFDANDFDVLLYDYRDMPF